MEKADKKKDDMKDDKKKESDMASEKESPKVEATATAKVEGKAVNVSVTVPPQPPAEAPANKPTGPSPFDLTSGVLNQHDNDIAAMKATKSLLSNEKVQTWDIRVPDTIFDIKYKEKWVSILKPIKSERMSLIKWVFDKSRLSMGNFSDSKTFIEASVKLGEDTLKLYDGVFLNPPDTINPSFPQRRFTDMAYIGFDVVSYLNQLQNFQYKEIINQTMGMLGNTIKDIYRASATVAAHPEETRLQNTLHSIGLRRVIDIDAPWRWFQQLNDAHKYVAPIEPNVDRRFNKFIKPGPFQSYFYFLDRNPWLRPVVVDMHRSIVESKTVLTFNGEATTVSGVMQSMQMSLTTMNEMGTIQSLINADIAKSLFRNMITAMLMGKYCRINMPMDVETFNPIRLLSCIVAKLIIPVQCLSLRTITDIDNTLALWLTPRIPGYSYSLDTINMSEVRNSSVNFLQRQEAARVIGGENYRYYFSVFGTTATYNGKGWGATEGATPVPVPADSDQFLGRTTVWYVPFCGRQFTYKDVADGRITPQLERYIELIMQLKRNSSGRDPLLMTRSDRQIWDKIWKMMDVFMNQSNKFTMFAFKLDEAQRRLNLMSTAAPIVPGMNVAKNVDVEMIETNQYAPISLYLFGEFSTMNPVELEPSFIRFGWAAHEMCNQITEKYYYVDSIYNTPIGNKFWKRSERLDMAFNMVTLDVGFLAQFIKVMKQKPNVYDVSFPPRTFILNDFFDKMSAVNSFINQLHLLLGFSSEFRLQHVYAPINQDFLREWRAGQASSYLILNRDGADRNAQESKLGKMIADTRGNSSGVRFSIPINVSFEENNGVVDQPKPITYTEGVSLKTSLLKVYYTWKDKWEVNSNASFEAYPPEWVITEQPYIDKDHTYVVSLISQVDALREGWTIWSSFKVLPRV